MHLALSDVACISTLLFPEHFLSVCQILCLCKNVLAGKTLTSEGGSFSPGCDLRPIREQQKVHSSSLASSENKPEFWRVLSSIKVNSI